MQFHLWIGFTFRRYVVILEIHEMPAVLYQVELSWGDNMRDTCKTRN